ncbi:vomeronasal type-2 receptor 26-like [Pelobates fuscus]|uniref:vomeronasal type-2 receptor 26-like n=1 Tax=Pelobates fuscus TaxID=191477 RepID=UPI002FE4AC68
MTSSEDIQQDNHKHTNLKEKPKYYSKNLISSEMITFEKLVMRDINKIKKTNTYQQNLTRKECMALKKFQKDKSIIIKPADKGGGVVLMTLDDYNKESHRLLEDTNTYIKLRADPTKDLKEKCHNYLNEGYKNGILNQKEFNYLKIDFPKIPVLYHLPKVHKNPTQPPGRPIVSGIGSISCRLSEYIDQCLQPIVRQIPSYLKDTGDILRHIDKLVWSENYFLTTADYYRHFLALVFAIDEINRNPNILPNLTLGYHMFDSCCDVNTAIDGVIRILSGSRKVIPNYSCRKHGKLVGFIGDLSSDSSVSVAHVLGVHSYLQISYGTTSPLLSEKNPYPSFFRTVQDDKIQFVAISNLLIHLGWNWVGIITSPDDSGKTEGHELVKEMTKHKICIEFTITLKTEQKIHDIVSYSEFNEILYHSTSQVFIICGTVPVQFFWGFGDGDPFFNKTLIFSSSWIFSADLGKMPIPALNGSLHVTIPRRHIPGLQKFLRTIHPSNRPDDSFLEDIWVQFFECLSPNQFKNELFVELYDVEFLNCKGNETITDISNVVYDTKLHHYIRRVNFIDPIGEKIYFNEKGVIPTQYHIVNQVVLENGTFLRKLVGHFTMLEPDGKKLIINTKDTIWKGSTNAIPQSQCSDNCIPGFRRVLRIGKPACCYNCVRCSEGEISTETDVDICQRCPETQWPNERGDKCQPKTFEFLSYETDLIASIFSFFAILFSVLTAVVLVIFIVFRDTPIVRANNRNLSFVLLISLCLSFLCVFFFIGRPVDATCMLRHASFGIIFTVAVSSVLAKTIIVGIAFKATKPGNKWNKLTGLKIANNIFISCFLIQVLICVSWLVISPPFQDLNMNSLPGKIIVKCNEGSSLAFYCVIGYIGLLAAMSFIVAYLVRTLPNSFNEGKHITFSMLVFCCVWACVIPAYLSTQGKDMVSTEIFAILASSAGLLMCIFFPKCYIILLKPHRNTKRHLLGNFRR